MEHPDRGNQYASDHDLRVPASEGITFRMSGVGRCWDNASVESFFGRPKCEIEPDGTFATRDQVREVIVEYPAVLDNRVRRRSPLGFLSPAEFERTCNRTHR